MGMGRRIRTTMPITAMTLMVYLLVVVLSSAIITSIGIIPSSFHKAYAQTGTTITWTGNDGMSWSDPRNWDLNRLPTGTDNIVIKRAADIHAPYTELDTSFTLEAGGSITINSGATLDIRGEVTLNNNGGTINNNGNLFVYGTINNNNGGTININYFIRTTASGTINNNNGGSINFEQGRWVNLDNFGAINNKAGGTIRYQGTMYNRGPFTNYGILDNYGAIINHDYWDANVGGTITNYGTLNSYGAINNIGGTITNKCGATFNNQGTFEGNGVVNEPCADTTPPTITVNPVTYHGESFSYADGQQFYYGDVPPAPTCTAVDNEGGSGLDTEYGCQVSGYGTDVGEHTLIFTAKDKAGNTARTGITYEVLPWTIKGFYSPVKMADGAVNTVKSGSTVPLKFEVFAGSSSTELKDPSAVVASLTSTKVDCNTGDKLGEPQPLTPQGGTSLRYDTTAGQFIFNWQTPQGQANTCYDVHLTTKDGSDIVAEFQLK